MNLMVILFNSIILVCKIIFYYGVLNKKIVNVKYKYLHRYKVSRKLGNV